MAVLAPPPPAPCPPPGTRSQGGAMIVTAMYLDPASVWEYGRSMVKMTFTFDEDTVRRLRTAAARLARPQSHVVREAVREYADRIGMLSDAERRALLQAFDAILPTIPPRPLRQVRAELAEVRAARRRGGRKQQAAAS